MPYESGLAGEGFAPGKTLTIFALPEKKVISSFAPKHQIQIAQGKRFHINILKKNGDIALHFNPRFDEKVFE